MTHLSAVSSTLPAPLSADERVQTERAIEYAIKRQQRYALVEIDRLRNLLALDAAHAAGTLVDVSGAQRGYAAIRKSSGEVIAIGLVPIEGSDAASSAFEWNVPVLILPQRAPAGSGTT